MSERNACKPEALFGTGLMIDMDVDIKTEPQKQQLEQQNVKRDRQTHGT